MNHRQTDKAPTGNRHVGLPSNRQTAPIGGAVSVTGREDGGTDNRQAPICILLSESASRHLDTIGQDCFAVIGRGSWPDQPSRWRLWLVPCPVKIANDAVGVAKGTHRATRKPSPIADQ
jgi:hypothetical protein